MTPLSALPIAAAALSLPLAWRTPAHRPLAVALIAAQALEAARPALPPELAWGALLALPALSAWAVTRTLRDRFDGLGILALWGIAAWGSAATPWSGWWPLMLSASVAAQGGAWWRWRADRREAVQAYVIHVNSWANRPDDSGCPVAPPSASELTAIALAFGDAGGLLVGLAAGWAAVGWWAAAVAAVLVGVQARAIWRAWR